MADRRSHRFRRRDADNPRTRNSRNQNLRYQLPDWFYTVRATQAENPDPIRNECAG